MQWYVYALLSISRTRQMQINEPYVEKNNSTYGYIWANIMINPGIAQTPLIFSDMGLQTASLRRFPGSQIVFDNDDFGIWNCSALFNN